MTEQRKRELFYSTPSGINLFVNDSYEVLKAKMLMNECYNRIMWRRWIDCNNKMPSQYTRLKAIKIAIYWKELRKTNKATK